MSIESGDAIWIVVEGFGEYSDRCETPIAWYRDEASAKRHAEEAGRKALIECRWCRGSSERRCSSRCDFSIACVESGKWPFELPPQGDGSIPAAPTS